MAVAAAAIMDGCTSNRFQLANSATHREDLSWVSNPQPVPATAVAVPAQPIPAAPAVAVPAQPIPAAPAVAVPSPGAPGAAMGPGVGAASPPIGRAGDLFENPNPNQTGAGNQRLLTQTPRPGPPGSTTTRAADGPELAGRIVNPAGQPEPGATIEVRDLRQGGVIVAEVGSGPDGSFRVLHLAPGVQYEIRASSEGRGRRLLGRAVAMPPDTGVLIQLDDGDAQQFSPLGNRLSTEGSRSLAGRAPSAERPTGNVGGIVVTTPVLMGRPRPLPIPPPGAAPSASPRVPLTPAQAPPSAAAFAAADRSILDEDREEPPPRSPINEAPAPPPRADFGLAGVILPDPAGRRLPIAQGTGELLLLDFFGSWCGPCRRSIPRLNQIHRQFGRAGLEVVGIACEHGDESQAVSAADRVGSLLGIEYPVRVTPLDEPSELRERFRIEQYPTLVLIDRSGRVVFQTAGGDESTMDRLEQAIRSHLPAR